MNDKNTLADMPVIFSYTRAQALDDGVLVDLGAFPALIPDDGYVKGVMLQLDREALEITDQIEGYSPDRRGCLYLREEVVVQLENEQEVVAWGYVFTNLPGITDCPRLIVGELNGVPLHAWLK